MRQIAGYVGRAALSEVARSYARYRWRSLKREALRPWRDGRSGTAAGLGRWIGFSMAIGAKAIGVGAAVYVVWRQR